MCIIDCSQPLLVAQSLWEQRLPGREQQRGGLRKSESRKLHLIPGPNVGFKRQRVEQLRSDQVEFLNVVSLELNSGK